ncbi:MAG: penicillin-binding protein 2 [Microbacteriaceae bacterium]|nr:penicillin-binding protein 2 [Microbacteriaceae bacterium]
MNDVRSTKRRLAITVIAMFAVVAIFVIRLVDIQVVRAEGLNEESMSKRSISETTYGPRGDILDTNGTVLADSVDRFDITASPQLVDEFTRKAVTGEPAVDVTVADAISELSVATGTSVADVTTALTAEPTSNFTYVARSVTLETLNAVQALKIPWVYSQYHPSRTYPNGSVAGNLVGFIGTDGPQNGLEVTANDCVGSTDGSSVYERGADGIRIPGSTVTTQEAKVGGTLKLTIDSDFQWYVQQTIAQRAEELGADWATAVVTRVSDGHLMAVADYPSVDPNNVDGSATTALGSLAFSTPFEPGSTMKALTMASLIDAGRITPLERVTAPGRRDLGDGQSIKDSWAHADINYTAAGVLTNSSNTGTSLLADKLGKDARRDYMIKFGLNSLTDVGFQGESSGFVPETSKWDSVTNYAVQFGQGMTATSAQMASAYQAIGNGGVRMPLTLVEGCEWPDGTVTDLPSTEGVQVVSKSAADQTVAMMENVVSQGALSADLTIPGYRVAAKTGTAEVAAENGGGYTSDRIISIAGLVPAENPEYSIVVTFGKPDTKKTSAAVSSSFKKITTQVIKTFRIEPSSTPTVKMPLTW